MRKFLGIVLFAVAVLLSKGMILLLFALTGSIDIMIAANRDRRRRFVPWPWTRRLVRLIGGRPRRPQVPLPVRGAPGERISRHIPQDVRVQVAVRDGGRCVRCGSGEDLQYDHKIPWSRGGAATTGNIQLMCGPCNRAKGAALS